MTIIKYCVPIKCRIQLDVFNYEGKKIKSLISKVQDEGTYQVKFFTRDFPDGIYKYQLIAFEADSQVQQVFGDTKNMILLK